MIDIFDDEEFKGLPEEKKANILNGYFDEEVSDDEFTELPQADQDRIRGNFIGENINIGHEDSLENYPNIQKEETTFQYLEDVAVEFMDDTKDVALSGIDYVVDNVEPMYDLAGDVIKNRAELIKFHAQLLRRPVLGMTQWVSTLVGDDDEIVQHMSDNEQGILDSAKKLGYDAKDLQKHEIASEVLQAYLPIDKLMKLTKAIKNPIARRVAGAGTVGVGEAILAGATQSGKEKEAFSDKAESASITAGFIGAIAPVALEKVIFPVIGKSFNALDVAKDFVKEIITAKASPDSSYDFLLNKIGATAKDADKWNDAYSLAVKKDVKDFTAEDKIAALLSNSDNGAALKKQTEYIGADGAMAREAKLEEMFKEMVFKETKDGSLEIPSLQLKKYLEDAGTVYGEVEDILKTHYNNVVKISPSKIEGLEEILTSSSMRADDITVVKRIITDLKEATTNGLSVEKLLNMKHDLSAINLKSTKKWKAGQVGDFIDKAVKEGIGEEGFAVWKEVNQRYAAKSLLQDNNPIAKLLKDGYEGTTNFKVIAEELLKIKKGGGYKTFNQIKLALGDKVSASLEKEMINVAFNSKGNNTFDAINQLKNFDFATTEGRGLIGELNRLDGLVPEQAAKELINETLGMPAGSSVGWSDDILAKVRYGIVGKVFNSVTKRMPMNKIAKEERVFEQVSSQLRKGEFKADISYIKDSEFNKEWINQEKLWMDRIAELKGVGEARTAKQNKELAETVASVKKLDTLGVKQKSTKATRATKPSNTVVVPEAIAEAKANPMGVSQTSTKATKAKATKNGIGVKDNASLKKKKELP